MNHLAVLRLGESFAVEIQASPAFSEVRIISDPGNGPVRGRKHEGANDQFQGIDRLARTQVALLAMKAEGDAAPSLDNRGTK